MLCEKIVVEMLRWVRNVKLEKGVQRDVKDGVGEGGVVSVSVCRLLVVELEA